MKLNVIVHKKEGLNIIDEVILGTDINSNYNFKDGDLILVSDKDNLIQSVINRLNTRLNSMNLFYANYGSKIKSFLGWFKRADTLRFVEMEFIDCLRQDPRCQNITVKLEYNNKGILCAYIDILINDEINVDINLVLNEDYTVSIIDEITEYDEEDTDE